MRRLNLFNFIYILIYFNQVIYSRDVTLESWEKVPRLKVQRKGNLDQGESLKALLEQGI